MNSRVRMRNRTHLPYNVLESILFRQHIEKITSFAYNSLNPFRIQETAEPHSIAMAISLHLEYKLAYPSKAKAAMPPRISQDLIRLTVMSVPRLPCLVPMHRSPPALVVHRELEGVKIVLEPQVEDLRHLVTPSQEVYSVSTRDLVHVRHEQQVIISDPSDPEKLV